ncbi:hypothetical protein GIB67_037774 [Kingdonia uniflora]|uniref:Bulb-type lectin domain-containing protein n=1 Tax=Kingdonia uniflora TaxID=39325 RepID=A0A7J7LV76_9MAGN|nr:hypothetical protein GIB67_037774 [Kingdonia uniflora]
MPVWVANRDTPVPDSSGVLTIDNFGRLTILYGGGGTNSMSSILLSSKETSTNVATVTLLDSGNFILEELEYEAREQRVLWQSFDYPTDVLLPGMKLGINLKTGHSSVLTSSVSDNVPFSGAFILRIDPNNIKQLVIWRRGEVYWKSDAWNGLNFNNSLALTSRLKLEPYDYLYNFWYISSKSEKYFTFSPKVSPSLLVWGLGSEGDIWTFEKNHYISGGGSTIDCRTRRYNASGCVDQKQLACRNVKEWFEQKRGSMSGGSTYWGGGSRIGRSNCEALCKSICSCVAYAITKEDGTGCNYWLTGAQFISHDWGLTVYVSNSKQGKKWWVWLIVPVIVSLVLLVVILNYLRWKALKERGESKSSEEKLLLELNTAAFHDASLLKKGGKKGHGLLLFSFDRIAVATDNFSPANKLG